MLNKHLIIGLCIFILAVGFVSGGLVEKFKEDKSKDDKKNIKDVSDKYLKEDSKGKAKVYEYTDTNGKTWLVIGAQ